MSKLNTPQKWENIHEMCTKIGGPHLQCVNKHYAKFEYKEWKLLPLQITQTRHPKSVADVQTDGQTEPTTRIEKDICTVFLLVG